MRQDELREMDGEKMCGKDGKGKKQIITTEGKVGLVLFLVVMLTSPILFAFLFYCKQDMITALCLIVFIVFLVPVCILSFALLDKDWFNIQINKDYIEILSFYGAMLGVIGEVVIWFAEFESFANIAKSL